MIALETRGRARSRVKVIEASWKVSSGHFTWFFSLNLNDQRLRLDLQAVPLNSVQRSENSVQHPLRTAFKPDHGLKHAGGTLRHGLKRGCGAEGRTCVTINE